MRISFVIHTKTKHVGVTNCTHTPLMPTKDVGINDLSIINLTLKQTGSVILSLIKGYFIALYKTVRKSA